MVLVSRMYCQLCKCDFSRCSILWGRCATTSGNLICNSALCFSYFYLSVFFFFVTLLTADITASSETRPQLLCVVTPTVFSSSPQDFCDVVPCSRLLPFSEAVCTRLPAYEDNFLSCTLNDAFYLSCLFVIFLRFIVCLQFSYSAI